MGWQRAWIAAFALWLSAWSVTSRAAASDEPARLSNVTLIQSACAVYETAEFVRLLQIELSLRGVSSLEIRERLDDVTVGTAGLAVVHMHCDAEQASVSVEVADLMTGNRTRRDMSLADLDPALRARALSLAVSALIEAAWYELALNQLEGHPDALPPEVAATLRKRIRSSLEPLTPAPAQPESALALMAAARSFPSRSSGLLGLELQYTPLLGMLRFSVSAEALFGEHPVSDSDGQIARLRLYTLGAGFGLAWASSTRPELALGPCVRLGYAGASASELRAGAAAVSGGGFVATLGLAAVLRAELSGAWDLWLGADLGYALSGVAFQVGQKPATGMSDLTFALRAGLGARL